MISSKVFSKSLRIYISKGEKLLSFHTLSNPPSPPPLLKVTFISESVFLRVYHYGGFVTGWCYISICFWTISGNVLIKNRRKLVAFTVKWKRCRTTHFIRAAGLSGFHSLIDIHVWSHVTPAVPAYMPALPPLRGSDFTASVLIASQLPAGLCLKNIKSQFFFVPVYRKTRKTSFKVLLF